ncbi:hypothetical protein [Bacteroides sp. 51]|uniref:hypothetical protein n=1 Tax=Bacteroides sp. 51 TaxID=2302938 RepID=UPI0013D41DB6|nr:hypothetical protein [Bacteroides sp. 51]NDV80436.1 hypothetical protein [Bacteroides sp. 51]
MEFPTKGKTQFEYELHKYSKRVAPSFNQLVNENGSAGGLRVSSIKTLSEDGSILYTKKYYYAENKSASTSSGILRNKPVFNLTYNAPGNISLNLKSTNGFNKPITNMNSPTVGYSCVIEETLDNQGTSQGYIKRRYTNFDTDIWGGNHFDEPAYYNMVSGDNYIAPFSSKSMERGKLLSEEYFDKDGNPMGVNHLGTEYVYLWGYNGQCMTMMIENATYNRVNTLLQGYTNNLKGAHERLNEQLPDASVTVYKYTPDLRPAAFTGPNGMTLYYEYDPLGRLTGSYMEEGELRQKKYIDIYNYNYSNQ